MAGSAAAPGPPARRPARVVSRLRIVAGEFGGRLVDAPPGRRSRPTREEVREAWFSALGSDLAGLRVADLFAGSGALGLEALSRGAAHVHFVESHGRTAAVLAANVDSLGVADRAEIVRRDVGAFLDALEPAEGRGEERFDLALADPPYGSDWPARLAERMGRAPFARLLCVEHPPGALDGVEEPVWRRRYGETELTFLGPGGPEPGGEDAGAGEATQEGAPER